MKKIREWSRRAWWLWGVIGTLFLVVVGLNIYVWNLHCQADDQLGYFSSSSYTALLSSVLIPLFFGVIARFFKTNEKLDAQLTKTDNERKEQQYSCIKQTNAVWNELCSLCTEVAYYNYQTGPGELTARDLRKKLELLANSGDEMFFLWGRYFPEIPPDDLELFLPGINILLLSAASVADVVENNTQGDPDVETLQECLLMIQDAIRTVQHQKLLTIFHFSMAVGTEARRNKEFDALRPWSRYLQGMVRKYGPNLPVNATNKDFLDKREKLQSSYAAFVKKKTGLTADQLTAQQTEELHRRSLAFAAEPLSDSPEFDAYKKAFDAMVAADLGKARKRLYSSKQIQELAKELFYQFDCARIQEVA